MTKKSVRRSILSLILTLAMVIGLMPVPAMAAPVDDESGAGTVEVRTTGLFVTDCLEWPENAAPVVGTGEDGSEIEPSADDIWESYPEASLYAVYKETEGGDSTDGTPSNLCLYHLTDRDTENEAVGDKVEDAVTWCSYWDGEKDCDSDKIVTLHFPGVGDYLLCHTSDTEKAQGIKIHVDYPWLGAYGAETVSADNYLPEIICQNGTAEFYLTENFTLEENQEFAYGKWTWQDDGTGEFAPNEDENLPCINDPEFDGTSFNDGVKVTVAKVAETTVGQRIYKVTVSNMPTDAERNLCFEAKMGEDYTGCDVYVRNPSRTTGLLVTGWLEWENGVPSVNAEAVPNADETWERIPEVSVYAIYKETEEAEGAVVKAEDLKLYQMENGTAGEEVAEAVSQCSYWDENVPEDQREEQKSEEVVTLHFPDVGDYLLCHQNDTEKTQGILIHVGYPELGVYSESTLKADALKSEITCKEENKAEFYIIEQVDEYDGAIPSVTYGTYEKTNPDDENAEAVFTASDIPCVQDENWRDKVQVELVGTASAGRNIYKVTVDTSELGYNDNIWLEFNGQYQYTGTDEDGNEAENTVDVSCGVSVKPSQSGLFVRPYDENLDPDFPYDKEVLLYEKEMELTFEDRDKNGDVQDVAWSGMTAKIVDADGNVVATGEFVEENRFSFDFTEMEFGQYSIVLSNAGGEIGQVVLHLPIRSGWYFENEDGNYNKIGDILDWSTAWGKDENCFNPVFEDKKYIFEENPALVYRGVDPDAETYVNTSIEFKLTCNDTAYTLTPSNKQSIEDGYALYTFDAADIYKAEYGNESGSGTFEAINQRSDAQEPWSDTLELMPQLRKHDVEAYTGTKYYSGFFMAKAEYDAGNWDYNGSMGVTEPTYWAFGKTVQEVLDKLKAKAAEADSPYKYEYINISTDLCEDDYGTGEPEKQILDVGDGELKGLRLYAATSCPWSTITIKGSMDRDAEGNGLIKMSGKWKDKVELNISPKLCVFVEYGLGVDTEVADCSLLFPDDLAEDSLEVPEEYATKDAVKVNILKNVSYDIGDKMDTPTSFTIQCAMSEAEAEEILPQDNIESDFIAEGAKENVAIGVAWSEGEETPEQSIADVIDFEDSIVKEIINDSEAKLETALTINKDNNAESNAEAKTAIQAKMKEEANPSSKVPDSAKKFQFVDISLKILVVDKDGTVKKDDENQDIAQTVTETNAELQISIPLPEELKWTPSAGSKAKDVIYNVYRYHNGVAERINTVPIFLKNGILTFRTDKFSTYAIEAVENEAQSIQVTKNPAKTDYVEGEIFSPAGMELTVTYLDGTVEKTTAYTVDKTAALAKTDTKVTVTCMGLTAELPITVSAKQEPTTEPTTQPTTEPTTEPTTQPTTEPTTEEQPQPVKKGQTLPADKTDANYSVTKEGTVVNGKVTGAEVEYKKPHNKTAKVTIPATITVDGVTYKITSVAKNAFKNDKKITTLKLGSNVKTIGANAFYGCTRLKNVTLGSGLTKIGDKAFYKCGAITKLTIPAKVTEIGKQAFYNCKKLKTITIKSTKLKKVGSKAISGIDKKAVIRVPKSKLTAYKKRFNKKTGFKKGMKFTK